MPPQQATNERLREVQYEVSRDFVGVLGELGVSLLVSTYQAGKVVVLGTRQDRLALSFHNFHQAMGCALGENQLAVGGKNQIWFLQKADPVVGQLDAERGHDACFLTRSSHVTDDIDLHEMAWNGDELWFVNTRFSCLCTWDPRYSFAPRWRPPFVSQLAAEDRCHLNGMCVVAGTPRYVTAMAETDTAEGWRPFKSSAGCVVDVTNGQVLARGFAMPHSPRVQSGRLWVLDSGRGRLTMVDAVTGAIEPVTQQPGYTRGLAFVGPFAFVGLSKIRETAVFGGLPIAENREELKCAVVVVDLRSGKRVAYFEFLSGVEEIFDVQVMPNCRNPHLSGPWSDQEGGKTIWYAPSLRSLPSSLPPVRTAAAARTDAIFAQLAVPEEAVAAFQRGNELTESDHFAAAVPCFEQAIALAPTFAEAHCNLGLARQFLGQFDAARRRLTEALTLAPESPAAHMNLATTLFLSGDRGGDLVRAWHEYEWRWRCHRFSKRDRPELRSCPAWDGSSLAGRTLLVLGEQGVGDEVMFASCLPDVIAEAARCLVACEARLVPLFQRSFPKCTVLALEDCERACATGEWGRVDFQIPLGSLPRFLRPTFESFPRATRYLTPSPRETDELRRRMRERERFHVGISWKGGSTPEETRRRSSRLVEWRSVLAHRDIAFVSLQHGDTARELAEVKEAFGVTVDPREGVDPLADLDRFASLVSALDLVISIDNSTLHLAGALGTPTLGLVSFPSSSAWRWFATGEDTVWYANVRLIRRTHPADWQASLNLASERMLELARR